MFHHHRVSVQVVAFMILHHLKDRKLHRQRQPQLINRVHHQVAVNIVIIH
ncbi:hypothetical protein BLA29_007401 [Euroglyphus maynei]|uniref:Uncharacterized protein n=1 Tax=Euroglyphus maynei TaxID=6958 RepID=A0A1Y3ARZ2_EURMA|nr:hypothetical protein BLA29_007401 [Euroglyphus maynei]